MAGGDMLYVRQMELGPMQNFIYLVGARDAEEVAVIDPAWDVEAILRAAEEDGKVIRLAFVTHHHHDHINGLGALLDRLPGLRIVAQREEIAFSEALQGYGEALQPVDPGAELHVGPQRFSCIHTPGHTVGAHCLHAEGSVFTGDTLFVNGCGRCDLPGGDPLKMYASLHRTLGALPEETRVYPGHDYGDRPVSTIGDEKRDNPYFQRTDPDDFVAFRMRPRT